MKAKTSIYVGKDKWAQLRGRAARRDLQASDLFEEMMDNDAASECLPAGLLDAGAPEQVEIDLEPVEPKGSVSPLVRGESDGRSDALCPPLPR